MIGVVTFIAPVSLLFHSFHSTDLLFPFVVSVLSYSFVVLSDLRALGGDTEGTRAKIVINRIE
jgi:hypothetical protein